MQTTYHKTGQSCTTLLLIAKVLIIIFTLFGEHIIKRCHYQVHTSDSMNCKLFTSLLATFRLVNFSGADRRHPPSRPFHSPCSFLIFLISLSIFLASDIQVNPYSTVIQLFYGRICTKNSKTSDCIFKVKNF